MATSTPRHQSEHHGKVNEWVMRFNYELDFSLPCRGADYSPSKRHDSQPPKKRTKAETNHNNTCVDLITKLYWVGVRNKAAALESILNDCKKDHLKHLESKERMLKFTAMLRALDDRVKGLEGSQVISVLSIQIEMPQLDAPSSTFPTTATPLNLRDKSASDLSSRIYFN